MSVPHDIEGDVYALGRRDARVHFVFQPIFGNFLLHDFHVPGVAGTEVAASASESEATLRAIRAEGAIRSTDWAALAEGNYVVRFLHGLGLCLFLGGAGLGNWLGLGDLVRYRNRVRQLLLHRFSLRQRLCDAF